VNGRVLLVDDEVGIRTLLRWELGAEGLDIVEAADGAAALDAIEDQSFDVIISDVRMPGLSGLDVLRGARQRSPETEVIIATGFADIDSAVECVRNGAFDLLHKPYDTRQLVSSVARALERRRQRSAANLQQATEAITAEVVARRPVVIVDVARQALSADRACLLLVDAAGRPAVAYASNGIRPVPPRDLPLERIAEQVLAARAAMILNAERRPSGEPPPAAPEAAASCLFQPLVAGDRAVGVLVFGRPDAQPPFRQEDVERAAVLGSMLQLALANDDLLRNIASSERLATIGQLTAGVLHEIGNPVSCLDAAQLYLRESLEKLEAVGALIERQAGAEALREAWREVGGVALLAEMRGAVADGADGIARIKDLTRDIKGLARPDEAAPVPVDLAEVVRSAVRVSAPEVRARTTTVVSEVPAGLKVAANPGRLSQVFINLLVNAAQAIDPAGERREILVRAWARTAEVVVEVRDTGSGISPQNLPHLFEAFFTTKPAGAGTGLGLWVSREIVRSYRGEIEVDSKEGEGTTFRIILPRA
jgi:signal transduction histidine kinase/CheY-like chemotaxis protein